MARKHSTSSNLAVAGLVKATARSRITNGAALLADADGRSVWYRRFRDLYALRLSDLGGESMASEGEKALARRSATLNCALEKMEDDFANAGAADPQSLEIFQRCANTQRRLEHTLGLRRRPRDITPTVEEFCKSLNAEVIDDNAED